MKKLAEVLRTTLIGGMLVVVPTMAVILVVEKLVQRLYTGLAPVRDALPPGLQWPGMLALFSGLAFVLLCLVAGAALNTSAGKRIFTALERAVLERIPLYGIIRSIGTQMTGEALAGGGYRPALAEIEDALVPALIVETAADGRLTVFVPAVPSPSSGSVYVLPPERVHVVDVPLGQFVKCITRFGAGTEALVGAVRERR